MLPYCLLFWLIFLSLQMVLTKFDNSFSSNLATRVARAWSTDNVVINLFIKDNIFCRAKLLFKHSLLLTKLFRLSIILKRCNASTVTVRLKLLLTQQLTSCMNIQNSKQFSNVTRSSKVIGM